MTSKLKTDVLETVSGSGTIALTNQLSGITSASVPLLTEAQMPAGSVIQVVTFVQNAAVSTSATSYTTMYGATITPSSTSSKILVRAMVGGLYMNLSSSGQSHWRLARGSSNCTGQNSHFHTETGRNQTAAGTRAYINMEILDSPSTTSATTYNVQAYRFTGSGSFQINDTAATSIITLMEIKG
tara:strand:+ start:786 stop:1337 length:552 start_codon:yes stop_codon:yes gene_type:complete